MHMKRGRVIVICLLVLVLGGGVSGAAVETGEFLRWRQASGKVDAQIRSWGLERLLETISRASGWEVLVEPDAETRVSATFSDLPRGQALRRLLGDLNYAILPGVDGVSRLMIYETDLKAATRRIKAYDMQVGEGGAECPKRIGNELVVKVKGGQDIEALARKLGAQVVGSLDAEGLHRLRFEDEEGADRAAALINEMEGVDSEPNYAVPRPTAPQSLPTGAALPFSLNPSPVGDNGKLTVGLIDTAVQRDGGRLEAFLLPEISLASGDVLIPDSAPTHGTSMAETVLRGLSIAQEGGSSSVRILPVDVYGNNETSSTFDVARGISEAIKGGANYINLSLGGTGDTEYLHELIRNGSENGVTFLASAGNQPVTTPVYPAAYEEVIAVTAGDRNGQLADYANRGAFVDVIAPGGNVVSYAGASYLVSGTSPASAFATGMTLGVAEQNGGSAKIGLESLRKAFEFKQP